MAISKSLRFSVLRRDNYTCRYCGTGADKGAELVVDHIVPVSHGGVTDAVNLVTACFDCNAGKAATLGDVVVTSPDEQVLDQMRAQVLLLSEKIGLERQLAELRQEREETMRPQFVRVYEAWDEAFYDYVPYPKDGVLERFLERIGVEEVIENVDRARRRVGRGQEAARYFYGTCWRQLREAEGGEEQYVAEN